MSEVSRPKLMISFVQGRRRLRFQCVLLPAQRQSVATEMEDATLECSSLQGKRAEPLALRPGSPLTPWRGRLFEIRNVSFPKKPQSHFRTASDSESILMLNY